MVTPSRLTASRLARLGLAAGTAVALVTGVAPAAQADDTFELAQDLRGDVKAKKIMRHLERLDAIAARHGGTRASGTTGYEASVAYVVSKLEDAGYEPTTQEFDFPFFQELSPSVLQRTAPTAKDYETAAFTFSGAGDVTGPVQGVDLALDGARASTSGCEASDFGTFEAGNIALIQRGTCSFAAKANNAAAAGARAVVIFNQGNDSGRMDRIVGTLGGPMPDPIPVVGASFDEGVELNAAGTEARVKTDTVSEIRQTWNVFAETAGGDPDNIVMAGAHLDSVTAGPGVNDNGSGSASILEVARKLADGDDVTNKVRFAWWGAEELGKLGSVHYVNDLKASKPSELDKIALYLNFDMVGSPNYVRFVYDGDNSRFPVGAGSAKGPQGSAEIEALFHDYFASQDLASEETPFSGRSDYGPFIETGVDIPSGGLFTGAEGVKTEQQAAIFGGQAGVAYDACYHQACDGLGNVNPDAIAEMSGAVAHAVGMFAVSTHPVNGKGAEFPVGGQGKPVGTGTTGGGGLHDDHDEHHQTS